MAEKKEERTKEIETIETSFVERLLDQVVLLTTRHQFDTAAALCDCDRSVANFTTATINNSRD